MVPPDAVRNAPRAFELFVLDEIGERLAEHVGRFGIAHEIHREIHHVQQVDERAAAGEFLGGEPAAETGNAGAADPFGLGGIDCADHALVDVVHHRLRLGPGPVVEVEEHLFAGLLRGGDDFLHFSGIQRRGLFGKDVFAGFEALDRQGLVELVGNDDAHRLDLRAARQHGFHGIIGRGNAPLLRGLGCGAGSGIGHRHDLRARLTESRRVILQHAAGSDDSYFG